MKRSDRNKVKTEANQGHPNPHETSAENHERQISGSINVRGEIEARRPPDLAQEHEAERKEDSAHERKKFFMECITLAVVTIYAGLTAWQASSANKSAQISISQLRDAEAVQSARLTFENFKPTVLAGKDFIVEGTIDVRNSGGTVADDISFNFQRGTYNLEYNPNPTPAKGEAKATPNIGGISLGAGQTRTYPISSNLPLPLFPDYTVFVPGLGLINVQQLTTADSEKVKEGKLQYFIIPTVSYNDIFGRPHITTDCLTYESKTGTWTSCPNLRQHE